MLLLFLPGRKRYRAALGLGLVCVLSFALGCGGGGGGSSGPVATITKLSVNNSKLASNDPIGFKFSINVIASVGANGQVQLFDGSTALGTAASVSNGSASITSTGLAAGTHAISAHYLGDSKTLASNSGALNITSTGTTTFVITSTPAASNGSPTVNITIN
jgi:Bacterial Ig-like domain (group 3)